MEEILHYSQYDYLLCFDANDDNETYITGSSNRAIGPKELLEVNEFLKKDTEPNTFKQSSFLECFELLSREKQNSLSKYEKAKLAYIRDLFEKIKEELSKKHGIALETAQLLFVMPLGWTEEYCKDKLRTFFQDVGWITSKDNKSKLVTIPYIQALTEFFQQFTGSHFDRERTSVLFQIQNSCSSEEGSTEELSYTFFKMQSAKELIAVSKKLASSDFLLVPSIGNTTPINLASTEDIVYNVVRKIIAGIKQGKHPRRVSDEGNTDEGNTDEENTDEETTDEETTDEETTDEETTDEENTDEETTDEENTDEENTDEENTDEEADHLAQEIGEAIFQLQEDMLVYGDTTLKQRLCWPHHTSYQFRDLGEWTCRQFIAAIYEDIDVKHYLKQVGDFFRGAIDEYGTVRDSPDGIQHILLYNRYQEKVHFHWDSVSFISQRSIEEGILPLGKNFITLTSKEDYITHFAMQQSNKMIQIANAVLPPVIVDDKGQNDPKLSTCKPADNLIMPNSFYVQANVTETQISFILNKVIEVSSSNTGIDLFTVQERAIEMENIAETASYLLWNHYQAMNDMEEQQHALFERCQDHDTMVLLSSHYKKFSKNASGLIKSWFSAEDTSYEEGLDTYWLVSVDQQCSCSLKLSQRMLMEVGLKPAIANIATTITSALFSDAYFGLYQPSALILERNFETIKSLPFSCAINGLLKQALKTFLQLHHNRLLLLFQGNYAKSSFSQYLGRGEFSQISSAAYIFSVTGVYKKGDEPILGVLKDGTLKKLPHVHRSYRMTMSGDYGSEYEFTYLVLAKEYLPLSGVCKIHFGAIRSMY
ncbi:hypothetical protein MBANPS3_000583 [Mucor bainieri]